jgi:hypothetical protein
MKLVRKAPCEEATRKLGPTLDEECDYPPLGKHAQRSENVKAAFGR